MFNNKNKFLSTTYKCNAFCQKCVTRWHVNNDKEMSLKTLDAFLEKLRAYNFEGQVNLGTAEPLIYEHLDYLLKGILAVNDKVTVRLLTNGMALTPSVYKAINDTRVTIGITLDAMSQSSLVGLQAGVDLADVKLNVLRATRTFGADHLYLNLTLYRDNTSQILDFCEFAVATGIKEVYITPVKVFSGFEKELSDHTVLFTPELASVIEDAKTFLVKNGIDPSGIDVFKTHHRSGCYLRNNAGPIIDVDGSVCFCSGREDVFIGNIEDDDIVGKWNSLAKSINTKQWCGKCGSNPDNSGIYPLPSPLGYHI